MEARDTGKPKGLTRSEEVDVMVDQFRFVAGAARNLEGRAGAEHMAGHTS
jgi:betaine-aldehyde dehydrogenase